MDTLLHLGFGHPSLSVIVAASVLAFVAGLAVRFHRTRHETTPGTDATSVDEET
ncbi:hypothetical protein [Halorubellus sp. PRR65]|uniref:hypothetical protein n=1 Tax=Halorubellus sp. PRR65 TaxID=3098148 RepID=UPI002B25CE03|nr:hypothetical protein [Halorubellus sp. PRR65]